MTMTGRRGVQVQTLPPDEARGHEPLIGVNIQLFNRRMRKRREACNFSQYELADSIGIGRHRVSLIETFRVVPTMEEMNLIATALYDEVNTMFPRELRELKRAWKPSMEWYLARDGIKPLNDVEDEIALGALRTNLLTTLTPRERTVMELRFGLEDGRSRTFDETANEFQVTRERVRQIEAGALGKMRRSEWIWALLPHDKPDDREDRLAAKYAHDARLRRFPENVTLPFDEGDMCWTFPSGRWIVYDASRHEWVQSSDQGQRWSYPLQKTFRRIGKKQLR